MMIRTVKYELPYDKVLIDTVNIGTEVFRFWSDTAFKHGTSNVNNLHHYGYYALRKVFPSFPSALCLTVRDTVIESRRSAKTNKGEKNPVVNTHPSRGLRYNARCFNMKNGRISISTVDGRKKYDVTPAPGYEEWNIISATLKITEGRCFIHVQYEKESPPAQEWKETDVLGIDRGVKNIIATSDNEIINSKHLRSVKGKYQHMKAELQSKGTRSAMRRFTKISGKERRFVRDVNHCISKQLAESGYGVFALEELTNIRKNAVKGKMWKPARKMIGGWAFRQLAEFLEYKAEERGKVVVYVNPKNTSQRCSYCGHTEKDNRKGSSFACKECGFSLNADLNASRNIAGLGISVFGRVVSQGSQCSS